MAVKLESVAGALALQTTNNVHVSGATSEELWARGLLQ